MLNFFLGGGEEPEPFFAISNIAKTIFILDLGLLNNLTQLAECLIFSSSKITPP